MQTNYWPISRQPGTNTSKVVDSNQGLLPDLEAQLPAALELGHPQRPSVSIREVRRRPSMFTLDALTGLPVVLVILLFLRKLAAHRSFPSLALPSRLFGHLSRDVGSSATASTTCPLMALTLSGLGFVVDDAIVMLGEHRPAHGDGEAADAGGARRLEGDRLHHRVDDRVARSRSSSRSCSWAGIVGRLMHEFAVTIGAAILVSGLVSLTLTPMLCSRFLKPLHSMHHGLLYNSVERVFDAWLKELRLDAEADDPLQGRHDGRVGDAAGRHRLFVRRPSPKVSFRASTPGRSAAVSSSRRASATTPPCCACGRSWRSCRRIRTSPRSPATRAAGVSNIDLKPRLERKGQDQRT
jgi:hypothetical protein